MASFNVGDSTSTPMLASATSGATETSPSPTTVMLRSMDFGASTELAEGAQPAATADSTRQTIRLVALGVITPQDHD